MLKNKGHLPVKIVFCRYTYNDLSLNSNLTKCLLQWSTFQILKYKDELSNIVLREENTCCSVCCVSQLSTSFGIWDAVCQTHGPSIYISSIPSVTMVTLDTQ